MSDPIFKSIFGSSWQDLPPVMKKHYAIRPFTNDETRCEGHLDVVCNQPLKFLAPVMKLLGQIPAFNENSVPVTVDFRSDETSRFFHFDRTFHFAGSKPYRFHSRMVQVKGNEVIEIMRFGFGWRLNYGWDGEKVVLGHRGYAIKILGFLVPVPMTWIFGSGYAEERAIDENNFEMMTHITHPLWGKVYEYKGRFRIV